MPTEKMFLIWIYCCVYLCEEKVSNLGVGQVILCFILDREMNVGRTELQFAWIFDNIV